MRIHVSAQGVQVCIDDHLPTCGFSCSITLDGEKLERLDVRMHDGGIVTRFSQKTVVYDEFRFSAGLLVVQRRWELSVPGAYRLHNSFYYHDDGHRNDVLVPAVWYQDNEQGVGCYPNRKLGEFWAFKENRMPVPGCIQLYNGETVFCCSISPAANPSELSSSSWDPHGIRMTIPGSEWPYSYRGKSALIDTSDEPAPVLFVESPVAYERMFFIQLEASKDRLASYRRYVESLHTSIPSGSSMERRLCDWDAYGDAKMTRILNLVRRTDDGEAYLQMGEGNGAFQPVYEFTSASFLVKSLEAATCMARAPELGDPLARRRLSNEFGIPDDSRLLPCIAHAIGRFFLRAESPEGIFRDCYDLKREYFGGYLGIGEHQEFKDLVNSRCNGEAMKQYVRLYAALADHGIETPEFLGIAKRVAAFYCRNQLSTGSFGRWWNPSGMPVNTVGTNGAYVASFLLELLPYLDDEHAGEVLSAVHQAYAYYSEMADEGQFYGDTLDADSCDKEAGLALLGFFLDLYESSPDSRYLRSAIRAADFVLLWIWQTDQTFPPDSPLARERFSTTGMTSVSVAHHHMDFYGMLIAYDFLRLAEATDDRFYKEQALLMLDACRQLVGVPDDMLGRSAAFLGWQPEQINYTDWDYFNRSESFFGTYDIDIAWVNVLGLGAYQRIRQRFPAVMEG